MNYTFTNMKNKLRVLLWAWLVLSMLGISSLAIVKANEFDQAGEVSSNYYRTQTRTKKGIQEAEDYATAAEIGASHTLFNVCLNQLLNGTKAYVYKGKTYYFDEVPRMSTETVSEFNKNDVAVTVVLLMQMDYRSTRNNLIYPGATGNGSKSYYAWNIYDPTASETLEALLDYLASVYGRENCHVDNWIVGNEVNMPNAWNYTGTTDLATNVDLAARSFIMVNKAIKRYNSGAKAYLSLDHSWTHNDQGRGIAGRTFLDAFAAKIEELAPGIDWNLAYHPYAPIMTRSNIWNSADVYRYTPRSVDASFISAYNLSIMTDYVKEHFGEQVRIILSEQGFTAYNGQEMQQAAAMAYTYYEAEFNDMIDATMFRSIKDAPDEMKDGFYFGLFNSANAKRPVFDVFKYMDTENWEAYTANCLATMGIALWNEAVTYFDGQRFIPRELEGIKINKTGTVLAVGYKEKIKYKVEPEFADTKDLTWVSDDVSVAKTDTNTGEIIAVAPGRAIVSAVKNGIEYASCIVVVKDTAESIGNVEAFINNLYEKATGQAPNQTDLLSYRDRLMGRFITGAQVVYEVIARNEANHPSNDYEEFVKKAYCAVHNVTEEDVTQEMIEKYVFCLEAGMSKKRVIADFIDTVEFDYRCYDADIDTGNIREVFGLEDLNLISYNVNTDVTYKVATIAQIMLQRKLEAEELKDLCRKINSSKEEYKDICHILYISDSYKKIKRSNKEFAMMLYDLSKQKTLGGLYPKLWNYLLDNGNVTRDEMAAIFFEYVQ